MAKFSKRLLIVAMEKSYQVTQLLRTSRGNGEFTGKLLQQQPGFSKHIWNDLPPSTNNQKMTMVRRNANFMNGTAKPEAYLQQPTTSYDAPPQSSLEIIAAQGRSSSIIEDDRIE